MHIHISDINKRMTNKLTDVIVYQGPGVAAMRHLNPVLVVVLHITVYAGTCLCECSTILLCSTQVSTMFYDDEVLICVTPRFEEN